MKKKFVVLFICLIIGICYYIRIPDYIVFNSMSYSSRNTRDTRLKVMIYKDREIDKTIKKIESEHNRINGTPTTLEIKLYYPSWFTRYREQPFKTVIFKYP